MARGFQLRKGASLPLTFTLSTTDYQLPLGTTRIFRFPERNCALRGQLLPVKSLGSPALSDERAAPPRA